jgi:hypothetical protein
MARVGAARAERAEGRSVARSGAGKRARRSGAQPGLDEGEKVLSRWDEVLSVVAPYVGAVAVQGVQESDGLREWAFNATRRADAPQDVVTILRWVERNSLPVSVWEEPERVDEVLRAIDTRLDGRRRPGPGSATAGFSTSS